jgi:hypothetical protein
VPGAARLLLSRVCVEDIVMSLVSDEKRDKLSLKYMNRSS